MKDLLTDMETGDLQVKNGDFVVGDSTLQNQWMILFSSKGEFREDPLCSVGIENMLLEHDFRSIRKEIMDRIERDGQRVKSIRVSESELFLDAEYKK